MGFVCITEKTTRGKYADKRDEEMKETTNKEQKGR